MRVLKLIFAWCFAAAAVLCIWEARMILPATMVVAEPGHAPAGFPKALMVVVPVALAVLFGVAWWNVLKQKASAGKWGIAASLAPVVFGFLLMYGRSFQLVNPAWIAIVFGIGGTAVFLRRTTAPRPVSQPRSRAPIPGDGTNPILNKLVLLAGIGGGTGGVRLFAIWARSHGLPRGFPPFYVLQVVFVIFLVLAIHEAGHALAGMALRMKLIGFAVGPFQWFKAYGRWKFTFRAAGMLAFVGQTMVAPTTMENFRNRKVLQVAGGPAASLLAGLAAAAIILTSSGRPWAFEWSVLAIFFTITTLAGILNLIPFGSKSMYSDGAKLFQLLSGGLWTDYHRAMGIVSSISVTAIRPRDYDIATIEQAAGRIAQGNDELFMHLCSYSYYFDSGRLAEAAASIEKAEASCSAWSLEPQAEGCSIFVFGHALVRHDAEAAGRWWQRMESAKSFHFTENLWDARCALLWSDNRLNEAAAAWNKADSFARQLPDSGLAASELNAVRLLREALDEAAPKPAAQMLAL
jgi:hypothetical protein